ncbi:prenyltransferase/squalene oxidase repeat-containing protein [Alicyclobacillus mengziensis]|uniref:Squalene cyclase C-terminal domain-containing protein n=1 Tax=Alicyclobacillus mengziensis TaxID=2931921 RepID=A0A9X7W096_9BACL|nr:prenyltransferase/squalene oxidase repeat-containing protein [Alicyclobacillus mengziensis]QSO48321.1 hypothetical protein JZ786_04855 [Alicyclobacillus mengziensis]
MNQTQVKVSFAAATIALGTIVPVAFAAQSPTAAVNSTATAESSGAANSTSTVKSSAAATPDVAVTPSVVKNDMSAAVAWLDKNGISSMPDWTAVAQYAATGQFAKIPLPKNYVSGLKTSTDYARAILGLLADGLDPHSFQGVNLVAKLAATQLTSGANEGKFTDNMNGTGTDLINNQAWAIIALQDAGGASYNKAAAAMWLINHQNKDGGFGYSATYSTSDADDTAAAIVALRLLGFTKDSAPVSAALQYLKTQQAADGGLVNGSTTSNSDSTGVTIDALASVGVQATDWSTKQGGNPVSALLSFYNAKNGGFNYDNTGSEWSGVSTLSTRDSIFGLAAYRSGQSVYQRLQHRELNQLDPYWAHIYAAGGAWSNHKWVNWPALRSMAIAGSYLSSLTPQWQQVVAHHGEWVTQNGHKTWVQWGPQLANEALLDSFGLDTMHLNLINVR